MRFEFDFGRSHPSRRKTDEPHRLLVLSDLRHESRAPDRLVDRPIVKVDVDSLDAVLARYAPSLTLDADAGGEHLEFRAFDDFHPDQLVTKLSVFQRLRDIRQRLEQPTTFAAALAELQADEPRPAPDAAADRPTMPTGSVVAADSSTTSMFDRLLGQKPGVPRAAEGAPAASNAVDDLIRQAIAPYIVASPDPQLPQLLGAVDTALTDTMRRVLHDRGFQAVEATWRALQWLISSLELGEELELHLLHVTRAELDEGAALRRRLVDLEAEKAGGFRPSLLIGNYTFEAGAADVSALASVGQLAAALGAPFVGAADPSLLGTITLDRHSDPQQWAALEPAAAKRWQALRQTSEARFLGLAVPRFLLRLPYGKRTDPISAFQFEEQPPTPEHEAFLWGNPSFACAVVVGRSLVDEDGSGDAAEIGGLPAFVYTALDEPHLQPCAETWLNQRAVDAILARGLMPIVSFKDRDAVRLVAVRSIADGGFP
jgi:type VI secretion system protein ImpC